MRRKGLLLLWVFLSLNLFLFFPFANMPNSSLNFCNAQVIKTYPVTITSDADFALYLLPGLGTPTFPYKIENFHITASNPYGIFIANTTRPFIIKNCIVNSSVVGIEIRNVQQGTAEISGNSCNNNVVGIKVDSSDSVVVSGNDCIGNQHGLFVESSDICRISYNEFSSNAEYGIYLSDGSYSNTLHHNSIVSNGDYGVYLSVDSNLNTLHHNSFIDNDRSPQAYDSGNLNNWDLDGKGNYWNENSMRKPYAIAGDSNSIDNYPLNRNLELGMDSILIITLSSLGGLLFIAAIILFFIFREKIILKLKMIQEKNKFLKKEKKRIKDDIQKIKKERQLQEYQASMLSSSEATFVAMRMIRIEYAQKNVLVSFLAMLNCGFIAVFPIAMKLDEEHSIPDEIILTVTISFIFGLLLAPILVRSKQILKTDLERFEERKYPSSESILGFVLEFYFVVATIFILAAFINAISESRSPKGSIKIASQPVKRRGSFRVGEHLLFLFGVFILLIWHTLGFFAHLFNLIILNIQLLQGDSVRLRRYLKEQTDITKLDFSLNYYKRIKFSLLRIILH